MGEEWDASTPFPFFASHTDPGVAQGTTHGRRREFADFGWKPEQIPDPLAPSTFESARLRWAELTEEGHRRMLEWYRALLELRRQTSDLRCAEPESVRVDVDDDARGLLVFRRGSVSVACNISQDTVDPGLEGEVLLASDERAGCRSLPPDSVIFVRH
jgi:maltooligosyltrehalose trehalohydrolase